MSFEAEKSGWSIKVIGLFPKMLDALLQEGVVAKAFDKGLVELELIQLRDFATNQYKQVDDRPFGGGPGMLLMAEPLKAAILSAKESSPNAKVVYLSPGGAAFDQKKANTEAINQQDIIFICGRYEGIDHRIIETYVDEQWSLGDFVMSGGELALMSMLDAMIRLLPGVLGHELSAEQDSYMDGLLDCPHYTKPRSLKDLGEVPGVLVSGDHKRIASWRRQQQIELTAQNRPDLIKEAIRQKKLSQSDLKTLEALGFKG